MSIHTRPPTRPPLDPLWLGRLRYHLQGIAAEHKIRKGDFYEDCGYRPMVCIENDHGDLTGVSLRSGQIGCCSMFHCGVVKLTKAEALGRR